MKKLLPIIVLVVALAGVWFYLKGQETGTSASTSPGTNTASTSQPGTPSQESRASLSTTDAPAMDVSKSTPQAADDEGFEDEDTRPAVEIYKTADDALKAVKDGAKNYDDVVLEQFTEPGADCTWCDQFYRSISDLLNQPATSQDERSYYGEILAISGRTKNIQTLIDAIKTSQKPDDADAYREALELTLGKDDVVKYLGEQLRSADDTLKESLVAALTNQSTRLAADILYTNTVQRGDADGFYSQGIGLAEFIPDQDVYPYLQEVMNKRDQYSHLAAKALLNSGIDGLKIVVENLSNSKDVELDKTILKDAADHVTYDEATEAYVNASLAANPGNPAVVEFLGKVKESFSTEAAEDQEIADEGEEGDSLE